jgi:hypothetical protein
MQLEEALCIKEKKKDSFLLYLKNDVHVTLKNSDNSV